MATGWLYGRVKGISTSTTCDVEVINVKTLNLTKSSGEDYWDYSTILEEGDYSVKAIDTTSGAGGNNETKPATVDADQPTRLDFDIS